MRDPLPEDYLGNLSEAEISSLVKEMETKQKEESGRTATFGFIASSVFLFYQQGGVAGLTSWRFVLFVVVGMFVASVTLGLLFFRAQMLFVNAFKNISDKALVLLGLPYLAVQLVTTFFFTKLLFGLFG